MSDNDYVYGIDVSGWQGEIDWERVARPGSLHCPSGTRHDVEFAIPKDVEGRTIHRAQGNVEGALAAGIGAGAYGYLTPGRGARVKLQDPVEEAFAIWDELQQGATIEQIRLIAGDLENWSAIQAVGIDERQLSIWISQYLGMLSGLCLRANLDIEVVLYGRGSVKHLESGWGIEKAWGLWVPRYRTSGGKQSGSKGTAALGKLPGPYRGQSWLIHQYTSDARVDGIEGNVDANVMRREDWRRIFGPRPCHCGS